MNAQEAELRTLLYPAPGSMLREDHLERLAGILQDPVSLQAFDELLTTRIERRRRAGLIWDRAAAGELFSGEGEEVLVELSSQLAASLEARVVRQVSLPLSTALAFAAGLVLGIIGMAMLGSEALGKLLR